MSKLENSEALLDIGTQCSDPLCRLVDFLPFKCPHCSKPFCQEHYKVEVHKCPDYEEYKHNRVAPNCPFCRVPVALRPGEDPNVRLELHFERECGVLLGTMPSKAASPICARGNCKKVLFSPIKCEACRRDYCPAHRFPSDHTCKPTPTNGASGSWNPSKAFDSSALPSLSGMTDAAKSFNVKASGAVANAKKSMASAASTASSSSNIPKPAGSGSNMFKKTDRPAVPPNLPATTTPTTTIPNPTDESETGPTAVINPRAKAERESRLRAMRARNQKGLLSAEEKATLQRYEEEAKDDRDCVII